VVFLRRAVPDAFVAKQFPPFVREKFPRLAKQYEQWFAKNGYARKKYRRKPSERVARIREKIWISIAAVGGKEAFARCAQLPLSWDAAAIAQEIAGTQPCATG